MRGIRLKEWVARALGCLGFLYVRLCYATSRIRLSDELGDALRQTVECGVPTVFVCWHDEFLLSLLGIQIPCLRDLLFITNDSFGGIFLETVAHCTRTPLLVIRRKDPREGRIEAMLSAMRPRRGLAIAADYGKPWYKARPTAFQIARANHGRVIATRLEPKRPVRLGLGQHRAYFPLPFSEYALRASAPLAVPTVDDGSARLAAALDSLRENSFPWSSKSAPQPSPDAHEVEALAARGRLDAR